MMMASPYPGRPAWQWVLWTVAIACLYVVAARLGWLVRVGAPTSVPMIWPAAGVALGAVVVFGPRIWVAILLGSVVTHGLILYESMQSNQPLFAGVCLFIAAAEVLEAILAARLYQRWVEVDTPVDPSGWIPLHLDHPAKVFKLMAVTLPACVISGVIGVITLSMASMVAQDQLVPMGVTTWLGHATGMMLVAPVLIGWGTGGQRVSERAGEAVVCVGLVVGLGYLLASGKLPEAVVGWSLHGMLVLLMWAAFRLGVVATTLATMVVAGAMVWGAGQAVHVFTGEPIGPSVWPIHILLGLMALASVSTAALMEAVAEPPEVESQPDPNQELAQQLSEVEQANDRLKVELAASQKQVDALTQAQASASGAPNGDFLATMSHEIRTPLTVILGYADLLDDTDLTSRDLDLALDGIRRHGRLLLRIVSDIMDLSNIQQGALDVDQAACSPISMIRDLSRAVQEEAARKSLTFAVEYTTPIPETIRSDARRLRHVLLTLLFNAIKFTPKGGIRLVVKMADAVDSPSPKLCFDVIDTGPGMTRSQQARLFDAFSNTDMQTTRQFGGTGLGLMVSKRLVELMGGDIHVRSAPSWGSTFSVTIRTGSLQDVPMVQPPATQHAADAAPPPKAMDHARFEANILLAEDHLDNQQLIRLMLEKIGASVTVANDGRDACDEAVRAQNADRPFDLVIMDMQMPELDGYTATQKLRAQGFTGPIIALTAHAMPEDREKCLKAGCNDYIPKPIDASLLLSTLERHQPAAATQPH